jgi:hypothetical protein
MLKAADVLDDPHGRYMAAAKAAADAIWQRGLLKKVTSGWVQGQQLK